MAAVTVALLNQKGGVGKSSTCFHLSATLAKAGRRILLIDNDPQASLTQGFFGPEAMRACGFGESVAALYDPDFAAVSEAIIIDNPPNLHLCGWAALTASDGLVVPLQAEDYGAQGIVAVMEAMAAVRGRTNPALRMIGLLLTMYDKRLGIHVAYERQLRGLYGRDVFEATFPLAKDFKEAVAARLPVSLYKPRSAAAKAILAVGEELLRRIGRMDDFGTERSAA